MPSSGSSPAASPSAASIPSDNATHNPFSLLVDEATYGHVSAMTVAGAQCTASAQLPSGAISTAAGLQGPQTAGPDGRVTWNYRTSGNTKKGTGTYTVTCKLNGQTAGQQAEFLVQ